MTLIQIPEALLHELNVLVDEQHSRIEDLQTDITVLQSRNILLCSNLLHYFNKDQKRRKEASVMATRGFFMCNCNLCRNGVR